MLFCTCSILQINHTLDEDDKVHYCLKLLVMH
uniref:Uncharacterized protein n=1 Tax=Anguilla anguilla TaxID=7936 RepID=A0A0E9SF06_ANGAN